MLDTIIIIYCLELARWVLLIFVNWVLSTFSNTESEYFLTEFEYEFFYWVHWVLSTFSILSTEYWVFPILSWSPTRWHLPVALTHSGNNVIPPASGGGYQKLPRLPRPPHLPLSLSIRIMHFIQCHACPAPYLTMLRTMSSCTMSFPRGK